uniref:Uncharacterized protein n=1 Tax=viral metagenome TaxID=1070528 RepID=A0A6M3JBY2_9ZZZZ
MTLPQMFGIVVEYAVAAPQTFLVVNDPVDGWQMRAVTSGANACEWLFSMNVNPDTNEVWVIDSNYSPTPIYKSTDLGETWTRVVTTGLYLHDMFAQKTLMESAGSGVPFTLYRSGDGISWASVGTSTHALKWGWQTGAISAPDGAGRVHWAYEGPHPDHNLYYARSTDNGLNIETPIDLGIGAWSSFGIGVKDEWVYIIHTASSVYCSYSNNYGAAGSWTIADLVYTPAATWTAHGFEYSNYFVSIDGTSVYFVIQEVHATTPYDQRVKTWKATLGGAWSLTNTETFATSYWSVGGGVAPPTWVGPSDPPMAYAVWSDEYSPDVHLYCNVAEILVFDNNNYPFWLYPVLVGAFHKAPKAGVFIM